MAKLTLEIRYSGRPAEVVQFEQARVTVGREAGHVALWDPLASGQHGEFVVSEQGVAYTDLGSTNGSFGADGQRIQGSVAVSVGSLIRIGSSGLVVRAYEPTQRRVGSGTLVMEGVNKPGQPGAAFAATHLAEPQVAGQGVAWASAAAGTAPEHPSQQHAGGPVPPGQYPSGHQQPTGGPVPPGQYPGGPVPPGQYPGGPVPPQAHAPAGHFAGQAPGALPPGPPGAPAWGAAPDPIRLLQACIEDFRPHVFEAAKVLGVFLLPLAALEALGSFVPMGWVLSGLGSLGYVLVYALVGYGAQAEYAMRLAAGVPISAALARNLQMQRMFPWLLGILVPVLIASVGCVITFVLFGLFLLPVYMLEQRRGFDVNSRSLEISGKNWGLAVLPILIVAIAMGIANGLIVLVMGFVPYLGPVAIAFWTAIVSSVVTPFITYVQFRTYFALLHAYDGLDAAALVRSRPVSA